MSTDIQAKLASFRQALQEMTDPAAVMRAGEAFLFAVESLPKAEQDQYKSDIATLVAALEARILSLEQVLKDQQA